MVRQLARLSAIAVKNATAKGMYADGGGLYLQVSNAGSRSWIFRFELHGREREMGLGPLHDVPLASARDKAAECRKLKRDGIDPIETRSTQRKNAQLEAAKAITFKDAAEAYLKAFEGSWRNAKHSNQWRNTLASYAYPVFGHLSVQGIDVTLIMKVLDPIWTTKNETASRVRGRMEAVLDWATARGYRDGENPARWRGHLQNLLPQRSNIRTIKHHAALPYAEVKIFVTDLRGQDGTAARALEFLILTAARTGEVIGARWEEVDIHEKVWIVPASRMKVKKAHRVPLSRGALAILENLQESAVGEFVFPGGKQGHPLSNMAMLELLKRMGRGELTAHGFRSTFRDWVAEQTAHPAELAEMALAHTVANKVEAAYRRGDMFDKRRVLMDEWAKYCGSQTSAIDVPASRAAE